MSVIDPNGHSTYCVYVPNYGEFEVEDTRRAAEATGHDKRRWEGAISCQVYRKDLATTYDELTAQFVENSKNHRGSPANLLVRRAEARKALKING